MPTLSSAASARTNSAITSLAQKRPVLVAALSVLLAIAMQAQAQDPPANQDEINKQMAQKIQELEKQIEQLKQQQAAAAAQPVAEAPEVNEVAPRLKLNVFGDVGYQVFNHVPNTFQFGSLDLFMTARLSDKVSTLGEALFTAESDNSVSVDVERLFLKYQPNDYFSGAIGRYHTWVGFYNSMFNKGEFLETTIDRPFMYAFDDAGGVLPMQDVGISMTGMIPSGKAGLHYVVEVGNGRAWGLNVEPAQNSQDQNNSKSINGGLYVRPEKLSGLQVGFSIRRDNLTVPGPAVGETIATVHAIFMDSNYEILNEAAFIRHAETAGPNFDTSAFYTQWSRRYKSIRPYFRYQYFNAPSDDPVYVYATPNTNLPLNITTFVGRVNGPSAGIRYDFTQHSALKLQYDRFSFRGVPTENGLTSQVAFTF
jgi:hypothetical protein